MALSNTRSEYVTIGGIPVPCQIVDVARPGLLALWEDADLRGADRIVPGAAGARRYKRRRTTTRKDLHLVITGDYTTTGATTASGQQRGQLATNVDYLKSQWLDPTVAGDGTVAVTLHLPNSTTKTGNVHCLGLQLGYYTPTDIKAILNLELPDGRLT